MANTEDDSIQCKHRTEGHCKHGIKTSCASCKKHFDYYDPLSVKENWIYETGREEPEILGSGSSYYDVFRTRNKEKAFEKYHENNRTYLIRKRYLGNEVIRQWYDVFGERWIDE